MTTSIGHSRPGLLAIGVTAGLALELMLGSFLANIMRPKKTPVPLLIGLINIWGAIYMTFAFLAMFASDSSCKLFCFMTNLSSQLFLLTSDSFLLYVSYLLSNRGPRVFAIAIILILHRASWAIADLHYSTGHFDDYLQVCLYVQHPLTGTGYSVADIVCDIFSTVLIIYVAFTKLSMSSNMSLHLLRRNGCRSLALLATNSYCVYAFWNWDSDFFGFFVIYNLQAYIFARCVNYDLLFDEDVSTRMNSPQRSFREFYQNKANAPAGIGMGAEERLMQELERQFREDTADFEKPSSRGLAMAPPRTLRRIVTKT
ncbi:hypothetical protein CcCBS67573_g03398 [Chytriomyces confervae]|uniref:G-protein coupled receptors family 1 profile domain-containing protein n=1 Tax=Chytriomyces confervae TaxID=246404 RepID=A0A507FGF5_9FUNG|nr:hypothetical protein HDU80_003802 [Chytriomyces hyalinus]TPX75324.1 hypothetical protein CcCBS67573_g03398 [Chytriomyces confervae]